MTRLNRLVGVLLIVMAAPLAAESGDSHLYFVMRHSPGELWNPELAYLVQPGIGDHVQYINELHDEGRVVLGGPFLDNSGGMVVVRGGSQEEVEQLARRDPAVVAGLLRVEVVPWQAVMSSVRPVVQRRPEPVPRDQPFSVKSAGPNAPINIDEEQ